MPDSPNTVAGELIVDLARFGKVHLLDSVVSTNDFALSLAAGREPALVVAWHQTRGRGRFRRPWYSDDDSLLLSLLLFRDSPGFPPAGFITHLAGLSLSRAIAVVTGLETLIRWPNDIVHNERKLAGILCEARRNAVAVGVGLNVNQSAFPEELPDAGSLFLTTNRRWDKLSLLSPFLQELHDELGQVADGGIQPLLAELKARSAVLHKRVEVRTLLRRYIGTVVDIDGDGQLVLRSDSGKVVALGAGQVRRLH